MRVLVTGGTGFVGSWAVDAIQRAGHEVRLLVRSAARLESVLKRRGIEVGDFVVGDMTDVAAVGRALEGCDAVVHTAALMYGGEDVCEANVAGVRNVVGGACERGLDPVVYVSTIAAMFPPPGDVFTVDDPVTSLQTTYGRSKSQGELFARELQARGAPVVTVYPAGVYGPEDPLVGESSKGLRDAMRFGWPIVEGGVTIVDVRDLAGLIARTLEPGRGPRRYMAGPHFLTWREKAALTDALTGRRARRIYLTASLTHTIGRLIDLAKRILPFDYPLTYEAARMITGMVPCDSRAAVEDLGVEFRPAEDTLRDAIRWLWEAGEISDKVAGKLTRG